MSQQVENSTNAKAPRYWLSLDQVENPQRFAQEAGGEFASTPVREGYEKEGLNRRDFMKIMGASALMASLAGCTRRPVQKIVAYVNNPEEIIPGVPNYYASACPITGHGLIVKTREGRPIKIDGNVDYPVNRGAIDARGQAFVHDLYDPDRLRAPRIGGAETDWDAFNKQVASLLANKTQSAILTSSVLSPSVQTLIDKSGLRHVQADAISYDDVLDAQEQSYGQRIFPRFRFDKADVVVSIDADFLDTWGSTVENAYGFSRKRKIENQSGDLNKLVVFESMMRLTGQNADERHAILPQDALWVALGLAAEVGRLLGKSDLVGISAVTTEQRTGVKAKTIVELAARLTKARGRSLVLAGGSYVGGEQGIALQNTVNYLNSILGNEGETVDGINYSRQYQGSYADLRRLVADMKSGKIKNLVIQGLNPVYSLPVAMGFAEALAKVENVVYFTRYMDETAAVAKYVAAESHPLEAWGDVSAQRDLFAIVQPTIRPLWQTRSFLEELLAWSGSEMNAYEYVQNTWKVLFKSANFQKFWDDSLQLGVLDTAASRRANGGSARTFKIAVLTSAMASAKKTSSASDGLTMVFYRSIAMGDGSQSNNAILQELPDPVTKLTWGNYLSMSPQTAEKIGVADGEILKFSAGNLTWELPAHRQPGMRPGLVAVALGYGRKFSGRVGSGVGAGVGQVASDLGVGGPRNMLEGVKFVKTGGREKLACTQGHHFLEGRDIVFDTTLEEYKEKANAGIVRHFPDPVSIWSKHKYPGYKWGMTIDLNSCTGCSACVTACSVENNVPAVGKDQVQRGREMQWIRIDRYYSGDTENPETIFQPMLCQHCDNAPCETVCPVLATVHSSEGLNQMTYNRCVGTKYCSNNCPYKVRRFNWYENNHPMNGSMEHPLPLMKNPEVTLRSRGVMEKCTFCTQRIEEARSVVKNQGRKIGDKDLRTACQDACPTGAIVFGDANNPESAVSKLSKNPRGFTSLEELNVRPAITYLTKIRNREPHKAGPAHGASHNHHG